MRRTLSPKSASPNRVLSFDGGGIRGVLTLILLERLDEAVPGWRSRADLLAGTSTGGILALGLAHGLSPRELRNLYETRSAEIFADSWRDNFRDLGTLVGAQYSLRPLSRVLRSIFEATTLGDLSRRVLISTFDLDNRNPDPMKRSWAPKFFHNYPGRDSDREQLACRVALYTSAAPTFFPSVDGYIDGGVVANNPAMAALAQTQDRRSVRRPAPLEQIALLSLGTGRNLMRIGGDRHDWGQTQWVKPLLGLITAGNMSIADYQCRQLLGDRYHRVSPVFPEDQAFPMDGWKRIPELVEFASNLDLTATVAWLRDYWLDG